MNDQGTASVKRPLGGPVTLEALVRYAGASGDFNPLHYDPGAARAVGFDDVVVVGALTASRLMSELSRDHDITALRLYTVKFLAPVLISSALEAGIEFDTSDDVTTVVASAFANGVRVMDAQATFGGLPATLDSVPDDFTPR